MAALFRAIFGKSTAITTPIPVRVWHQAFFSLMALHSWLMAPHICMQAKSRWRDTSLIDSRVFCDMPGFIISSLISCCSVVSILAYAKYPCTLSGSRSGGLFAWSGISHHFPLADRCLRARMCILCTSCGNRLYTIRCIVRMWVFFDTFCTQEHVL